MKKWFLLLALLPACQAPISSEQAHAQTACEASPYVTLPLVTTFYKAPGDTNILEIVKVPPNATEVKVDVAIRSDTPTEPFDVVVNHFTAPNGEGGTQKSYSPIVDPGWVPIEAAVEIEVEQAISFDSPSWVFWTITFKVDCSK